jgi:hypothetical protein
MKPNFHSVISIGILSVIILLSSCKKDDTYSIIPAINYKGYVIQKSFSGKDSALKLTISYTDGDGDLGLGQKDTNPPFDNGIYYYNIYVYYYELINGKWSEVTLTGFPNDTDTIRIKYRFANLNPISDNKAIKGDIENTFSLPSRKSATTIKLKFYIYDRMLHKSNVDSTGIITYYNP